MKTLGSTARIIPGFLVKSEQEFLERLKKFEGLTNHIHIDVMDGVFVPNTTWADAEVIERLLPKQMTYELHLMVKDPLPFMKAHASRHWTRFVLHVESNHDVAPFLLEAKRQGKEVFLAINPETPLEMATKHTNEINGILVMGNDPGFSGRPLNEKVTLQRLRKLVREYSDLKLSVDVGVNAKTAPKLREAGATELISTSYLTLTEDVAGAIQSLKQ